MMDISDNMLSAFMCGVSTPDEDLRIFNEMMCNEEFSDMMDVLNEVNSLDDIDSFNFEFSDNIDFIDVTDKIR